MFLLRNVYFQVEIINSLYSLSVHDAFVDLRHCCRPKLTTGSLTTLKRSVANKSVSIQKGYLYDKMNDLPNATHWTLNDYKWIQRLFRLPCRLEGPSWRWKAGQTSIDAATVIIARVDDSRESVHPEGRATLTILNCRGCERPITTKLIRLNVHVSRRAQCDLGGPYTKLSHNIFFLRRFNMQGEVKPLAFSCYALYVNLLVYFLAALAKYCISAVNK
ncbi:unnamed protein product [Leptosia nina]|uniref:Uncharacterized protein n=1 Tax=Leptosia nina TaxID=320188 RepID=A0AAV1IS72_9NEOP